LTSFPGRTNNKGASLNAQRVEKPPLYSSIARNCSSTYLGSVMVAWCLRGGVGNAPLGSLVGSLSALPVATA